jgi:hypothetical protein
MKEHDALAIDAVITWVDGNDPAHKAKMETYLESHNSVINKSLRTRYDHVNEIEFCVKSILKYAKFVRNIYIVTDNQTPDFLKDEKNAKKEYPTVFIVDHKVIFEGYHQYLPTFNSRSIATLLYKIPNLSEHFIVMCDDFMLINETKSSDFFYEEKPLLRGEWRSFNENLIYKNIYKYLLKLIGKPKKKKKAGHFRAQQIIAKNLGFKKFYKLHHVPMPMRKSTLEDYFKLNDDEFENNFKYRFRDSSQFLLESLINHLEIKKTTCKLSNNYKLAYFQNYKKLFLWLKFKLRNTKKNKNKLFLCMQSLDQCPPEKLTFIKSWLEPKYN